jgi:hypothetical protein
LESEVGLRIAATRQKAGKFGSASALPTGLKLPAPPVFAIVIVTAGVTNFARFSQDCAWSAAGMKVAASATIEKIGI